MPYGAILQLLPKAISKAKPGLDYIYAVATGTAAGIGADPDVRSAYELWKGKKKLSYDDKITIRRLGKEPVINATQNSDGQTLRTVDYYPRKRGNYGYGNYSKFSTQKRRKYKRGSNRRKHDKCCVCRTVGHRSVRQRFR